MTAPVVQVESRGAISIITMDRPTARNAVNDQLARELDAAFRALDGNDAIRVGVLTGRDGFCAGLDLKAFLEGETGEFGPGGFAGLVKRVRTTPLVAAVEGFALAGGLEIALACDLIVAASDSRLGIPEVRRGLVADGGALLRLPRKVPRNFAMELALTGREVPPSRLYELGLISRVSHPGEALKDAIRLAQRIAENGPLAVAASRRIIVESEQWVASDEWEFQAVLAEPVWQSQDAEEGARAFSERRLPRFVGQ